MSPKTVFITGGAKGIGAGCAEEFAKKGYNIAINYKTSVVAAEELKARLEAMGAEVLTLAGDCSNEKRVIEMIEETEKRFGKIDVLVNNAGISLIKLFTDTTEEDWDSIFSNNLKSAFFCSKAVCRGMINNGGGSIINISSMWGITGASCEVAYSASKAGMIGLTKALCKELSLSNIRVNCVCPGVIMTDMNASLGDDVLSELTEQIPLSRLGAPGDVGNTVVFLAEAKYVTGQIIAADGGMTV
ncbi:MAG: SDR family oxidoreductase [Ruminococcaceae bacterium]|nr:SDR family oxidoreductase [Oscillospiraceae bacterium]